MRNWAELDDEEREDFWFSLRIARDERRYETDRGYRRKIDMLQSNVRHPEENQYPVALEFRETKIIWVGAESAKDALEEAKRDPYEMADDADRERSVDGWIDVVEIDSYDWSGYGGWVYPSAGDPLGPRLPLGMMRMEYEILTAWRLAHDEAARRERDGVGV